MSLRVLFVVQGQGRGHLTQAMALRKILERAGHTIVEVLVGGDARKPLPSFVRESFGRLPVARYHSPAMVLDESERKIDWIDTIRRGGRLAPAYRAGLRRIESSIQSHQPDVVINFFEPLVGWYYMKTGCRIPQVSIAHQHMFLHPRYPFPAGARVERKAMTLFTRLGSYGSTMRLALSLYPAESRTADRLHVVPPLLRESVTEASAAVRDDGHFLLYLWRQELITEVIKMNKLTPSLPIHCFADLGSNVVVPESGGQVTDTLALHPLSETRFIELMRTARGVASTAGFESTCEAMYLGKPLMMVPTHLEQRCNALDALLAGAGTRANAFDLRRLDRFSRSYSFDSVAFREWADSAAAVYVDRIEEAAAVKLYSSGVPG